MSSPFAPRLAQRIIVSVLLLTLTYNGYAKDHTCALLRKFISSVQAGETQALQFRTSWGGNFKDATDPNDVLYAKRCEHHDYPPARAVCASLMKHGAAESADTNVKNALTCLSRGTTFAPEMRLAAGQFDFFYGTENRGSRVKVSLAEDLKAGGMVMEILADGF